MAKREHTFIFCCMAIEINSRKKIQLIEFIELFLAIITRFAG